jgi:hypothetical protein
MTRPLMRRAAAAGLVAILPLLAAGCGGSAGAALTVKPVPAEIIPASLDVGGANGQFTLSEYPKARAQFAHAGVQSLVADGRLWELRQGPTLVGTLQLSTLKPTVHVAKWKDRNELVALVLPGSYTSIIVSKVNVYATTEQQLATYLWFGDQMFELLQIKARGFQPEAVLRAALKFQLPTKALTIPNYEAKRPKGS